MGGKKPAMMRIEAVEIDGTCTEIGVFERFVEGVAAFDLVTRAAPTRKFILRDGARVIRKFPDETPEPTFIDRLIAEGKFWP